MKTIRKIMEGVAAACISVAMYYCFLSGAPAGGTERTVYMILDGIFCISAWVAGVGILWYVRWLRRRNKELENMIKILLKNAESFTAVGDVDQSIYSFRGSFRDYFEEFYNKYNAELISLNYNYRSTNNIIRTS